MVMPATPAPITTIEELLALPDDGLRHELLDGVHVVTPAPRLPHQLVLAELHAAIREAIANRSAYRVLTSPADVTLGPRTLVQPDLFVIRVNPTQIPKDWREIGVPVLTVEILSPSTAARDRATKRRIFQRAGVGEYWIVDPAARIVERWRPGDERPEIVEGALAFEVGGVSGTLDLPAEFRRALGDQPWSD